VFKSDNTIKQFSSGIIEDICQDIIQPIDLFISSGRILSQQCQPYNLIVDELNLYDNLLPVINSYYSQLKNQGILIMNVLGGKSLYELADAMLRSDLIENRFVARMLPKISAEGLLSLANQSQFRYKSVMSNSTAVNCGSVSAVIQSLRELKLTRNLSYNQPTSRSYWQSVQEIFSSLYNSSVTIEIITLLASK